FFWSNMKEDISSHIKSCIKCAQRKKNPHEMTVQPIGRFEIPDKPFSRIHMDILGPLTRKSRKNANVLTIQDAFSKWSVAIPIPSIHKEVVIDRFLRNFVFIFGPPGRLITDRGSNFMSKDFKEMCEKQGIRHERTIPHQKNANGQVERLHRTIEEALTHYVNEEQTNWDNYLPKIIYSLNTCVSATTGVSPYVTLFGADARMSLDRGLEKEKEINTSTGKEENIIEKKEERNIEKEHQLHQHVRNQLKINQEKVGMRNNKGKRTMERDIKVGDLVVTATMNQKSGSKLRPAYDGPFPVTRTQGNLVEVRGSDGKSRDVHKDNLKRFSRPQTAAEKKLEEEKEWNYHAG
ncbi:unnamed protein product, partial [Auanema sp. JU1783]